MVEVLTIDVQRDCDDAIARAVSVVDRGGVVAFPTETVYGVGARADHIEAMGRLRRIKERTDGKPFTVHVADRNAVCDYVPHPPAVGRRLIRKGWPGPVTLLFHVSNTSEASVLRGLDEKVAGEIYHGNQVGLRCPDHEVARRLLAGVAGPMVAASANRAGSPPACSGDEALEALGDDIDLLLDAGPAKFGQPSTLVRVGESGYEVLREGVYDTRDLRRLSSMNFLFVCTGNTCRSPMAAGLCRVMVARRLDCAVSGLAGRNIAVYSAGTFAGNGAGPTPEAVEVMCRRSIDITGHVSMPLSPELINQADHIYAMTSGHAQAVTAMVPSAQGKTRMLCGDSEVDDPIGGNVAVYESCVAKIEQALAARLQEVELL
ncbi:MAG: threonylcarbamoyl-AMP synthase [Phycisphaerae bacterium]|nr:threonylcarbamoyl-AMP synthase [Phycisphaerae bacterium]